MRIDAYNAVSQVYRSNSTPVVKKADNKKSFSDKLEISQTAKTFKTAKAAVDNAPDIRADKVAQVKAQIEAGSYHISSEAVADKILENISTLIF